MSQGPGVLLNNRYRIESILGQGGMGAVYRAMDEHLDIPVAIKENLFLSEEYVRQFYREATILAKLRNENLPSVRDYFFIKGQGQYLIMDYIAGEDLRQRIERIGLLPEMDVAIMGVEICNALNYLHTLNPPIIHRDIKPGNIKITPHGEIVLVDFGLAKFFLDDQATTTGARAMTPGFSPPEQYGTARTDERSDIYSLGATLYAALTGKIPEDGLSRATNKAGLSPLKTIRPKLESRLAQAIERALSIEPEDRFQSAEEFKTALIEAMDLSELLRTSARILPSPEDLVPQKILLIEKEQIPDFPASFPSTGQDNFEQKKSDKRPIIWTITGLFLALILMSLIFFLPAMFESSSEGIPQTPVATSMSLGQRNPTEIKVKNSVVMTIVPQESPPSAQDPGLAVSMQPPAPTIENPIQQLVGGGSGKLAFVSKRTGTFQIWSMDVDGNSQVQISSMEKGSCQPDWSPDGSKLVVISPCESVTNYTYTNSLIYIMNSDGSNPTVLPVSQIGDFDPAWSPDGTRIAFSSLRSGVAHVFVYNFEDDSLLEVSDTRYPDIQPSWNPSGKQLAVSRNIDYFHIWLISDSGQSQWQFSAPGELQDFAPDWSPDGQFLLFTRSSTNTLIPRIVKLTYENRGLPMDDPLPPWNEGGELPAAKPNISPDGKWVLFESWPDGINHDIYLMDIDGRNRLRLTTDPGLDSDPVWTPKTQ